MPEPNRGGADHVGIPILMYHAVADSSSPITMSPVQFERQMAELKSSGCRVLSLGQLVQMLRGDVPLPGRAAVITFDDGYASVYERAWPILAHFDFPFTVFLVAGFCGRDNGWTGQPRSIPRLPLLGWRQVEEMDRHGVTFGAHTLNHPSLDHLAPADAEDEIRTPQILMEGRLGHRVELFAYPYGRHTTQIKALVGQTYLGACSTELGVAQPSSDPLALPRVESGYIVRPSLMHHLWSPGFRAYLYARRAARSAANLALNRSWR